MTNPSRVLSIIQGLVNHLESRGHEVPTRQVADRAGREGDSRIPYGELARRDLAWLSGCDALVAEVSAPSHGVGHAASEQNANKPIEDRISVRPLPDTVPGLQVSTSA